MCVAVPLVCRLANHTSSSFSLEEAEENCEQAVEKVFTRNLTWTLVVSYTVACVDTVSST